MLRTGFASLSLVIALIAASLAAGGAAAAVPPVALPPVVTGTLAGVQVLMSDFGTTVYFIHVDPATGAITRVSTLPGTAVYEGTDAVNNVDNRYYITTSGSARVPMMHTVDVGTGDVLASVPTRGETNVEFDPVSGDVLGIAYEAESGAWQLNRIDPATGATSEITRFDDKIVYPATSAIDAANGHYYVLVYGPRGMQLVKVDIETGASTRVGVKTEIALFEWDDARQRLVGVLWDGREERYAAINPATGDVSLLAVIPGVAYVSPGTNAYDPLNGRYFVVAREKEGVRLFGLAAATGGTQSNPRVGLVSSLEYAYSLEDVICRDVPPLIETIRIPVADIVTLLGAVVPVPDEVRRIVKSVGIRCDPPLGGPGGPGRPCGQMVVDQEAAHVRLGYSYSLNPGGIAKAHVCVTLWSDLVEPTASARASLNYVMGYTCSVPVRYDVWTGDDWMRDAFTATC